LLSLFFYTKTKKFDIILKEIRFIPLHPEQDSSFPTVKAFSQGLNEDTSVTKSRWRIIFYLPQSICQL